MIMADAAEEFPPRTGDEENDSGDLAIAFCPRDLEILIEILSAELPRTEVLTQRRECVLDAIAAFSKARQHAHSKYGYDTKAGRGLTRRGRMRKTEADKTKAEAK